MKKIIGFSWARPLLGVALCAFLFSFSARPGAHSFQVYLDDKLVIDQYVKSSMDAPKLWLDPAGNYSQLIVKYNECGRTVTGRTISIKDGKDKILKQWQFDGESTGYSKSMACSIKEIAALKPSGNYTLNLYYSSNDFSQGQLIAHVMIGAGPKASLDR